MPQTSLRITPGLRIGVVSYLNARPLMVSLRRLAPEAEIRLAVPSRLADELTCGRLDVAIVPSIEYALHPGRTIVSDACIACQGPVQSVKLFSRVPPEAIRTLALDEGSRTSAALVRILLAERLGLQPQTTLLPVDAKAADTPTDAVLLIGDRGMLPQDDFPVVWDLGEEWSRWTGLPFVFALWVARAGVALGDVNRLFGLARDEGLTRLPEIARDASLELGLAEAECLSYLRDRLTFHLGPRQRQGLARFYQLAAQHGLAPPGVELVSYAGQLAE